MQLEQPIPPSYPGGDNQFDFILNGHQKPKKGLIPKGNSPKQRIIMVILGLLAVLTLFAIIFALIFSSGGGNKEDMLGLAQTQTELVRISASGAEDSRDAVTQGFAQNIAAVITTSQLETTEWLTKNGVKFKEKDLALAKDEKVDAALNSALQAGRFDQELVKVLERMLAEYKAELSQAFSGTSSKSQKTLLQNLFKQVETIIKNQPTSS